MSGAFDPTPLRPDAPAMPVDGGYPGDDLRNKIMGGGLTARQHAAIALCVPDSGTDWLDAMIDQRRRDECAGRAMQAMITKSSGQDATGGTKGVPLIAGYAYEFADAMLAASKR